MTIFRTGTGEAEQGPDGREHASPWHRANVTCACREQLCSHVWPCTTDACRSRIDWTGQVQHGATPRSLLWSVICEGCRHLSSVDGDGCDSRSNLCREVRREWCSIVLRDI
jgi:hypothetical protein